MNLTFKTGLYIIGALMVLLPIVYIKGCSDGVQREAAKWRQSITEAKPDTTVSQLAPPVPKPETTYVRVIKYVNLPGDTVKMAPDSSRLEFTDVLERDLTAYGEAPLPFYLRVRHVVTLFSDRDARIETIWDSLSVPVRIITKVVLEPRSDWELVSYVAGGLALGVVIAIVAN